MQLLKHVAQQHNKNTSENQDVQFNKEEVVGKDLNELDQLEELEAELRSLKKEIM